MPSARTRESQAVTKDQAQRTAVRIHKALAAAGRRPGIWGRRVWNLTLDMVSADSDIHAGCIWNKLADLLELGEVLEAVSGSDVEDIFTEIAL